MDGWVFGLAYMCLWVFTSFLEFRVSGFWMGRNDGSLGGLSRGGEKGRLLLMMLLMLLMVVGIWDGMVDLFS